MKDKRADCDCCGFGPVAVSLYTMGVGSIEPGRKKWLCGLCANTHTGQWMEFRHLQGDALTIMKTICYVGNAISAAAIAERQRARREGAQ